MTVHYESRRAGHRSVFDSSYKRGAPSSYPLTRMIPGWGEGIPLMRVGAKWELYIPPELAYGEQGSSPVQPNEVLVFVVELLQAKPCAAPAT